MADFVGSTACLRQSPGMPRLHRPRFQGQGRPPGQAPGKGQDHDRGQPSASPATSPTSLRSAPPRVGSPGPCSGWPCRVGGTRSRRSAPWSCGATRPSMPPSRCRRGAGSWPWVGSSSGAGPLRTAPLGGRGRGRGAGGEPAVGNGDHDQDDEEPRAGEYRVGQDVVTSVTLHRGSSGSRTWPSTTSAGTVGAMV
jgi:hypothetical protein